LHQARQLFPVITARLEYRSVWCHLHKWSHYVPSVGGSGSYAPCRDSLLRLRCCLVVHGGLFRFVRTGQF
jgi:hypothetical protein